MCSAGIGHNATLFGNSESSDGKITSNHEESDTGTSHDSYGLGNIGSRGIDQTDQTDDGKLGIEVLVDVVGELVRANWVTFGDQVCWDDSFGEEKDSLTFGCPALLYGDDLGDVAGVQRETRAVFGGNDR